MKKYLSLICILNTKLKCIYLWYDIICNFNWNTYLNLIYNNAILTLCSRHLIHTKMSELMMTELPIVFPLNMTYVPLHEIKQPPWITIWILYIQLISRLKIPPCYRIVLMFNHYILILFHLIVNNDWTEISHVRI